MISLQEYQLCDVGAQRSDIWCAQNIRIELKTKKIRFLINISMLEALSAILKYLLPLRLRFDAVRR